MKPPCFKCDFRSVGCHAKCDSYQAWRKDRDEELAERKADKERLFPTERTRKNIVRTGTMSGVKRDYK